MVAVTSVPRGAILGGKRACPAESTDSPIRKGGDERDGPPRGKGAGIRGQSGGGNKATILSEVIGRGNIRSGDGQICRWRHEAARAVGVSLGQAVVHTQPARFDLAIGRDHPKAAGAGRLRCLGTRSPAPFRPSNAAAGILAHTNHFPTRSVAGAAGWAKVVGNKLGKAGDSHLRRALHFCFAAETALPSRDSTSHWHRRRG